MTYKAGDLVYFDGYGHKGVGKIVAITAVFHLVSSTQIVNGHNGADEVHIQESKNNWWFFAEDLKPFVKKEGQKYKVIHDGEGNFEDGDIVTLSIVGKGHFISCYEKDDVWFSLYDLDHVDCEVEFYEDVPTEVEATQPKPDSDIVVVGEKYLINGTPVSRETYLFVAGLSLSEGETQGSGSTHVTLSINRPTPGQEALTDLGYVLKEISTRDGEIWSKDGHDLVFLEGDFHVKLLNGQKVFTMTLDELHTVHTRLYEIERN